MNQELLQQAIKDSKELKMLCLSWQEGRFYGIMGYDNNGNVVRVSCHCKNCNKEIPLETSSSHYNCIEK